MKCPSCNKTINKSDNNCRFCGINLNNKNEKVVTQVVIKNVESKANKWLVLAVGLLSFLLILETAFNIWYFLALKPKNDYRLKITTFDYRADLPFETFFKDDSFEFDNLSIELLSDYKILKLENNYSIYNGRNVLKIPVKIKNLSGQNHSLNLFDYEIYDDFGNNIDEVAGYFDESVYYAEDLKSNETYTKYLYALYYGNDSYSIMFEKNNEIIIVKYNINN